MGKLIKCSTCGKDIAKSVKVCPHCGEKELDKASLIEQLTGVIILALLVAYLLPDKVQEKYLFPFIEKVKTSSLDVLYKYDEQRAEELTVTLEDIENSEIDNISSSGALNKALEFGSDYTDVQRENIKNDIKGKTVQWRLSVYEISKKDENCYRIQTADSNQVDTFITLYTRTAREASYIESLKTGDIISFKGKIEAVNFLRSIDINPAILQI